VERTPTLVADESLVLGVTSGPFGPKIHVGRESVVDQSGAKSHKHHDGITDRSRVDFVDRMRNKVAWKNI
jgi:hypothetical protein